MTDLEKQIINAARGAMSEAIVKELCGYDGALATLTKSVMATHESALSDLINGEFEKLLGGEGFKEDLRKALNAKLARLLIEKMSGQLEKRVNELKQNPETRAKITLAISKIIESL